MKKKEIVIIASTLGLCVVSLTAGCVRREDVENKPTITTESIYAGALGASTIEEAIKIINKHEEIKKTEEIEETVQEETTQETTPEETSNIVETEAQEELNIEEKAEELNMALNMEDKDREDKEVVKEIDTPLSFIDKRVDFWFTKNSLYIGSYKGPSVDFYSEYELPVSDYYDWNSSLNATYFKYYGEVQSTPFNTGAYIFNSGTDREKNIWAENQMKAIGERCRGMGEEEAVNYLIDYISNNFSYKNNSYEDGLMYTFLSSKQGNCEAYARLFKEICNYIGLDCKYIEGQANGFHAWNRVLINGKWYYVDITWYDLGEDRCRMSESLWTDHSISTIVD